MVAEHDLIHLHLQGFKLIRAHLKRDWRSLAGWLWFKKKYWLRSGCPDENELEQKTKLKLWSEHDGEALGLFRVNFKKKMFPKKIRMQHASRNYVHVIFFK